MTKSEHSSQLTQNASFLRNNVIVPYLDNIFIKTGSFLPCSKDPPERYRYVIGFF